MAEAAIIDASPLIFFSRSAHLEILDAFADRYWVPRAVADEILARGPNDTTAQTLNDANRFEIVDTPGIPLSIAEWRLGAGESAVLTLAMQYPGTDAVVDDLLARKCAAALAIPVRGTLGIVLTAKKRGIIPLARPVIEDMMNIGLYLSKSVLERALSRVGE